MRLAEPFARCGHRRDPRAIYGAPTARLLEIRRVLYLAIQKASERACPIRDWAAALNHFTIVFKGRVANP